MKSKFYKTVLMPILVPVGDYCLGSGKFNYVCCGHFDNSKGYPQCTLKIGSLKYDDQSHVKKPKECFNLKGV